MAILNVVLWGEVARKAPEIAERAKKLWSSVARKSTQPDLEMRMVPSYDEEDVNALKNRLIKVEAVSSELYKKMLTTSELVKALAEQSTQLINAIE